MKRVRGRALIDEVYCLPFVPRPLVLRHQCRRVREASRALYHNRRGARNRVVGKLPDIEIPRIARLPRLRNLATHHVGRNFLPGCFHQNARLKRQTEIGGQRGHPLIRVRFHRQNQILSPPDILSQRLHHLRRVIPRGVAHHQHVQRVQHHRPILRKPHAEHVEPLVHQRETVSLVRKTVIIPVASS